MRFQSNFPKIEDLNAESINRLNKSHFEFISSPIYFYKVLNEEEKDIVIKYINMHIYV